MLVRTLRPERYWSSIRMEQLCRPWRSVWFLSIGVLIVLLATGLVERGAWFGVNTVYRIWSFWQPIQPNVRYMKPELVEIALALRAVCPLNLVEWEPWSAGAFGQRINFLRPAWAGDTSPLAPLIFVGLIPLTYLALPMTLGAARVRKEHLLRAAVIGFPVALLVMEILMIVTISSYWLVRIWAPRVRGEILEVIFQGGVVWLIVLPLHQWFWWSAVNERFLRLERPRLITAIMLVVAGLATSIMLFGFTDVGPSLLKPFVGPLPPES